MRVVATAGHVDHGKSSLILALTGTDPDRFPEEKARGLTIDLGFAFTDLPSGQSVGFVDVPGHARFVKNMLAGVGAVEVVVLVVAADEGWMAQTEEHVAILDLLDIRHGMVALTKVDLVDDDTLELATLDVEERMPGWPVVAVDSVSGRGVDAVRETLDDVVATAPLPLDLGHPRLWIDRVFAPRGAGTVVTGTLAGGGFRVDDDVLVEPGRRAARIRGIQSHYHRLERVGPGTRVALNLAGIDHGGVARGHAVVRPGQWAEPAVVDVALRVLPGCDVPKRGRAHAHVGSGEHDVRIRILDDERRYARLHFAAPLPLAPSDRIVLRSSARQTTVGGCEILDLAPARRTTDAVARLALPLGARVMQAQPWSTVEQVATLAGRNDAAEAFVRDGTATPVGAWLTAPSTLAEIRSQTAAAIADETGPGVRLAAVAALAGIDTARLRAALADDPTVVVEGDLVRSASQAGITDDPAAAALLDALAARPFDPPPATDFAPPAFVRALVRSGHLVDLDGVVFHADALASARRLVADAVVARGVLTIADIRDLLGSTRKYVVPIANYLDAEGVTRRRGDERIPGPRATASR